MKFNTRLIIIFLAVILLPFLLATVTFFVICGSMVWNLKHTYGVKDVPLSAALSPAELYSSVTDKYMDILKEKLITEPDFYKNVEEIREIDNQLGRMSSFIIVKGEDKIYYIRPEYEEDEVLDVLPASGILPPEETASLYYNDIHRVVKQTDYVAADGTTGTIYVVTCVSMIVSDVTGIGVIISMVVVLLLTAILLTSWLNQGIIKPMISLKSAMMRIEQGDLETPAVTAEKGEVGELFEGFEKMRIRLKDSKEEKARTEEANKELIRNISHDLKTPITSIKGYVEGIMDGVADTPEKMEKYIKTIYNKAGDMDYLIDELTMYSKIDANQIPYQFHQMNVGDYFSDCAEEVGLDLETKGIGFSYDFSCDPDTEINADPEQLKRVINNIINNSVKYRKEEGSRIALSVSLQDEKTVLVEIEDNGKGISAKELEKVFERFYRTDASRNSKQGGSGIGLSIARKVVEDHGGIIWATGEEGVGLTIHFTLPVYKPEEEYEIVPEGESKNPIVRIEKAVGKTVGNTVAGIKTGVEKTMAEIEKKTKRTEYIELDPTEGGTIPKPDGNPPEKEDKKPAGDNETVEGSDTGTGKGKD
ncbi:MAG: HAMP domain-containing histidine kinase [Lachnospiraceae bacterium]|nr:HAMP domain-containing histidine kinase [Lachnospiraceae bacterium]